MKSVPRMGFKRWFIILASLPSVGLSCGINWNLPNSHFNAVSPQGYVDLWEKISEIDLGEGLKLPLHIEFESNRGTTSPTLGKGWFFPLLESYVIQENEDTFKLYQPEGRFRYFWRDKANPNILNGQGGWKAEIGNNTITAWSDCGWKLVYTRGKLTSLGTEKGRVINWEYGAGGAALCLKEGTNTILEVVRDPVNEDVYTLLLPNKETIKIERGAKPEVTVINSQKLVGAMTKSLSKITWGNGVSKTYKFEVNKEIDPTLTLDNERTITWDAESQKIKIDGEWKYNVAGPGLGRSNPENKSEYWMFDAGNGIEITQSLDSTKKTKVWFTSGSLAGKVRYIEEEKKGKPALKLLTASYDEKGDLLRKEENGFTYLYNNGVLQKILKGSDVISVLEPQNNLDKNK